MPRTGNGDGESVTEDTFLIDTEVGLVLDTPGIDDTHLRFTGDDAGRKVAIGVAASGVSRVKFVIFESLANDSMQLRDTLVKFIGAFGEAALHASVVLATKADKLREPGMKQKRLAKMFEVAQEKSTRGVVLWQNVEIDEAGHAAQLEKLTQCLNQFDGIITSELQDLKQRQLARAQQKCDEQPIQTMMVEVEVDEEYTVLRKVREPYKEQYTDQETYMEEYDEVEKYYDTVHGPGADGSSLGSGTSTGAMIGAAFGPIGALVGGLIGAGLGGIGEAIKEENRGTVTVEKFRTVKKERPRVRDVTKSRTNYRTVPHYDVKTRKVKKQVEKPHRHPVDHFMGEALEEIIDEIRKSFGKHQSKL